MFVAPPAVPDSQQKTTKGLTAEDVLSNPGTYEEIGRKLKGDYNNNIIVFVAYTAPSFLC